MRRFLISVTAASVLLAGLLVGVYLLIPALTSRLGPVIAAHYGLDVRRVVVGRPDLRRMEIALLQVVDGGTTLEAANGYVAYTLMDLWRGRFQSLVFAAVDVTIDGAAVADATEPGRTLPSSPLSALDFGAIFAAIPFTEVEIVELTLTVRDEGFRGVGRVRLEGDAVSFALTGVEPTAAESLVVTGSADSAGRINLELGQRSDASATFLAVSSAQTGSRIDVTAQVDLFGYALDLVSTMAGLSAGTGKVSGVMRTSLPWPPHRLALDDLSAQGEFAVRWKDSAGRIRVEDVRGGAELDSGVFRVRFGGGLIEYTDAVSKAKVVIPPHYSIAVADEALRAEGDLAIQVASGDVAVSGAASQLFATLAGSSDLHVKFDGQATAVGYDRALDVSTSVQLAGGVGGRVSGSGSVRTGTVQVPFAFAHNLADGTGDLSSATTLEVTAPLAKATLPGWREPYDLDSGKVNYRMNAGWNKAGSVNGSARVTLAGAGAHYGEVLVGGVNGDFEIGYENGIVELRPADLSVGWADVGVRLTNLRTRVGVARDVASVGQTTFELLGGRAVVSAFDYHLVEKNTAFEVALEGVNLQEVLALEGDDVQGSGTIGGTLPVAIRAGAPSVSGGKVSAVPPRGRIQVSPALAAVTGQPGLDFALRALTDFYFSALDASVDYASDGELALGLSLRGGNPQVENGRPIHYNLNVTENVPVLLQSLRAQRAVIEGVERRVLR